MAISVTELRSLLDTLKRARLSGVLVTRHGDKMIQYKNDADMAQAIADVEDEIAAASPRRRTASVASFSRGDH